MAELKRFIHTSSAAWAQVTNKSDYNNSIVFIHDGEKGISIYTQGATFDTELTASEVETIVKDYVIAGDNISANVVDGKLVISAPNVATTESVGTALTIPMSLSLTVSENKATFNQHFKNLKGEDVTAASAVIEGGNNVSLTQTETGLTIDAKDTKLTSATISAGEITTEEGLVAVVSNVETELSGTNGESISGKFTAVNVPTKTYVDNLVSNKNVTAEGDDYVTATAEGNKVTVAATDSTKASLALADSALQKADITEGTTNGTIKVDGTEVAVAGLGSAAYTESSAYDVAGAATTVKTELLGDAAEDYNTLGKLEDKILAVESAAKSYTIAKVESGLGENVKEAFKLVDEGGTQAGETIYIYKDSSLKEVKMGEGEDAQKLVFTYILANGNEEVVKVDVSKFLAESEFGNGLQVVDSVVSVKVKDSETYLKVGTDGLYTEGIDTAISTAIGNLDSNFENVNAEGAGEGEVSVVSGVNLTQVDGVITSLTVNSTAAATKEYVDSKAAAATTTLKLGEGTEEFLTLTSATVGTATEYTITINGVQTAIDGAITDLGSTEADTNKYITKIAVVDGKLTNEAAYVSEAQLVEFTTTSTDKYVGIEATDTINGAFDKVERAWDWVEITE